VPLGSIACAAGQHRQTPAEPFEQEHGLEDLQAGRSQLECQRKAVETAADVTDGRLQTHLSSHGTRPVEEERDCVLLRQRLQRKLALFRQV